MMIFLLAAGYLFTVYLLLGLAKRSGQKVISTKRENLISQDQLQEQAQLRAEVTEVVNSQ